MSIRHNELTRKCQFIDPKLRREIIESLVEGEQIRSELLRNHGRRAILYRARQGNSSNVNKASNDE